MTTEQKQFGQISTSAEFRSSPDGIPYILVAICRRIGEKTADVRSMGLSVEDTRNFIKQLQEAVQKYEK